MSGWPLSAMSLARLRPRGLPGILLVTLLGAALAARLHVALGPLTAPHSATLPDDAFYDFGIARHLAMGRGPTFDGVSATNGFHPLWVALLVPIWRMAPPMDRIGPLHAAMVLGSLLDVASLVVVWRLCRARLALSLSATTLTVAWLAFNPFQIMIATCGLEAPLAQFLLLLLLDEELATRWRRAPRLRWSFIAGLGLLARADLVILFAVLLLARLRRTSAEATELVRNAPRCGLAAIAAGAIYLPWLLYSRLVVGHWIQSSAIALPFSMAELAHVWGYESISVWTRIRTSVFALLDAIVVTLSSMGAGKGVAALLTGAGIASVLVARRGAIHRLGPYWVGLAALLVAHGAVRRVFREWYASPFSLAYAMMFGHAIHGLRRNCVRSWIPTFVAAAVLAAGIDLEAHDRLRCGYFGTAAIEAYVPPFVQRWGATDGGVYGYLAGDNRVNMDGIVNWDALDALRGGTVLDYVERSKIGHFWMAERYRHPRFMGRRWRERLVVIEPNGWRLASPEEKDERIALSPGGVLLGSSRGGEFLSDGWLWPEGEGSSTARSVGRESEIVFTLNDEASEK